MSKHESFPLHDTIAMIFIGMSEENIARSHFYITLVMQSRKKGRKETKVSIAKKEAIVTAFLTGLWFGMDDDGDDPTYFRVSINMGGGHAMIIRHDETDYFVTRL